MSLLGARVDKSFLVFREMSQTSGPLPTADPCAGRRLELGCGSQSRKGEDQTEEDPQVAAAGTDFKVFSLIGESLKIVCCNDSSLSENSPKPW